MIFQIEKLHFGFKFGVLDIVNPIFKEYPEIEEEIKGLVIEYKTMP